MNSSIKQTRRALENGDLSATSLVEACLARIDDANGEGARTFIHVFANQARAQADRVDKARRRGDPLPPYAGIPVSVKDLFDTASHVTRCASKVLAEAPAALRDADCIANLRALGFIIIGRTNMTEFAYSGLGVNPHFGTPCNPFGRGDPHHSRIPGGSSSGAAVSITDKMALGAIGSDTGGSCRIPAALCGITGFKPTTTRMPMRGVYPLAKGFDTPGPLAARVSCCAILDDALADGTGDDVSSVPRAGLRIGVIRGYVDDDLDKWVAKDFSAILSRLSGAGVRLEDMELPHIHQIPALNKSGGIAGAHAYALHKPMLDKKRALYDPWIVSRIEMAKGQETIDYLEALQARQQIQREVETCSRRFDALLAPTTPIVAPKFSALAEQRQSFRLNFLLLRNTSVFNFLDCPAISLPGQAPAEVPTGCMIIGRHGEDRDLLSVARTLEPVIRQDH